MRLFIATLGTFFFLSCSSVHAEDIAHFTSNLEIQPDSTVHVTEVIDYDFGGADRHGIFRILNTNHPQASVSTSTTKVRAIDITILSVLIDGAEVPFTTDDTSSSVKVTIGDKDRTITGLHSYEIQYDMHGALSYGPNGAEIYYNVTGNDWPVRIKQVTATVVDATGKILLPKRDCYIGKVGDVTRCNLGSYANTRSVFSTSNVAPGSGLTIAQQLDSASVETVIIETDASSFVATTNGESNSAPFDARSFIIGFVVFDVWFILLLIVAIRHRSRFKTSLPVIAQYEPYAGLLPMYTGALVDSKLDARDITAGIVYLAQQGFISIRKTEKKVLWVFNTSDYELTLLRGASEAPTALYTELLQFLFPHSQTVQAVSKISDLAKPQLQQRNSKIILAWKSAILKELEGDGFLIQFDEPSVKQAIQYTTLLVGGYILLSLQFTLLQSPLLVIALLAASLIFFGVSRINIRTEKGYTAQNHLLGFKLFLSVTETERYKFSDAPEKSPEVFMQYLPYAIAFGVEKEWSKVFEDITIPNPEWYDGGTMQTFSAVALASDIASFSQSFAATAPASGTSGSSGGGSSGGGGGGGGGGSW